MTSKSQAISSKIENNWRELNIQVDKVSEEFGNARPKIIAISKTRTLEEVEIAYDIGIRNFGENYAQEFAEKARHLPNANWHFVGHLQRGNAKWIIPYCNMLHTLDSFKLANRLKNLNFISPILIQIKMGTELSKYGISGQYEVVEDLYEKSKTLGLNIVGLMGIGSLSWDETKTLDEYIKISKINNELGLKELSLGMSDDFPIAMKAGSTMIRVGTKIFGSRNA